MSQSEAAGDLTGGLSSWLDGETRWVLATAGGASGNVVAFKLEDQGGKPTLVKQWSSASMARPVPPVIANGVVFALENGGSHATLHALDGTTGTQLWSTGNQVTAAGNQTGLTIANGRVYFATVDGTVWAFGMPLEW